MGEKYWAETFPFPIMFQFYGKHWDRLPQSSVARMRRWILAAHAHSFAIANKRMQSNKVVKYLKHWAKSMQWNYTAQIEIYHNIQFIFNYCHCLWFVKIVPNIQVFQSSINKIFRNAIDFTLLLNATLM